MFKWFMLAVYVILLIYTMAHFHKGLEFITGKKRRYLVGMCTLVGVCCLMILVGRFLPADGFRRHIIEFSNYFLGFWIYLVFFFALLDIALILRKRVWKKPAFTWHTATFGIILLLSAGLTVCGGIHARHVTVNTQNVTIHKSVDGMKEMKIVLVSDWHLGYSIGVRDMKRMVKKINEQNPDLVLVAGDIYDNEYEAIHKPEEVAKVLKGIRSRYGTYGVYGNHDVSEKLVGGFTTQTDANPTRDPRIDRMMAKAGITMLQD